MNFETWFKSNSFNDVVKPMLRRAFEAGDKNSLEIGGKLYDAPGLQGERDAALEENKRLREEIDGYRFAKRELLEQVKSLTDDGHQLQSRNDEQLRTINQLRDERDSMQRRIDNAWARVGELEAKGSAEPFAAARFLRSADDAWARVKELEALLDKLQARVKELEKSGGIETNDALLRRITFGDEELADALRRIRDLELSIGEWRELDQTHSLINQQQREKLDEMRKQRDDLRRVGVLLNEWSNKWTTNFPKS